MTRRALELLILIAMGGVLGGAGKLDGWTLLGALAGAGLWVAYDNWRALRVLRWLRTGEPGGSPRLSSLWGEVVERAYRGLRNLNRKARKSELRLQDFLSAVQASPNGVILLGKAATIEWCNLTAAQHLGIDPRRDLHQQIRNLVRDPDFVAYLGAGQFDASIEINGPGALQGHPQRIAIHIHPYGKGRKMVLTRDVTALQLAETMRRDFVANVSHEIRTPLTVVSGFIETLQHLDLSADEQRRYLGLMAQQSQRLQTLVSDLLTLSRLEGSPAPGADEWVDADDLLDEAVASAAALSDVLAEGQHHIERAEGARFEIAGARSELLSALSNLLGNAVRYTPAGGEIVTGWRLFEDGSAEFWVRDSGPGIAPEHLPRITERFYRVDRSRSRETGGTGLGLAIVKHVAQRHGGQLTVASTVGVGSEFILQLPASRIR